MYPQIFRLISAFPANPIQIHYITYWQAGIKAIGRCKTPETSFDSLARSQVKPTYLYILISLLLEGNRCKARRFPLFLHQIPVIIEHINVFIKPFSVDCKFIVNIFPQIPIRSRCEGVYENDFDIPVFIIVEFFINIKYVI